LEVAQQAVVKLEKVLELQAMSPVAWFTHFDTFSTAGGLGNGRLSVDELQRGLAAMTSGKVTAVTTIDPRSHRIQVTPSPPFIC
jgi:hypothetical protein